jgi:hypothetical protein
MSGAIPLLPLYVPMARTEVSSSLRLVKLRKTELRIDGVLAEGPAGAFGIPMSVTDHRG